MGDKRRTGADRGGLRRTLLVAAVVAAAACRSERAAAPLPAGMDSIPIAGHVLYVPTGFHVNIYAQTSGGPRFMAPAPPRTGYVAPTGEGRVGRLPGFHLHRVCQT